MKIHKLNKIMGVVFTVGMLLSMLAAYAVPASAADLAFSGDPSAPSTTTGGTSSFSSFAVSADGKTLYGADNSAAIYKSTNGGTSWTKTSFTAGMFSSPVPTTAPKAMLVAVAPDDANIVVFSSNSNSSTPPDLTPTVYVSTNGGTSFVSLTNTTGAPNFPTNWSATGVISAIAISQASAGIHYIGIAGQKTTPVVVGTSVGVSIYGLGGTIAGWQDTVTTGGAWTQPANKATLTAAKAIKFSPNFASDRTFTALLEGAATAAGGATTSAAQAFLETANVNLGNWNANAGFSDPVAINLIPTATTFLSAFAVNGTATLAAPVTFSASGTVTTTTTGTFSIVLAPGVTAATLTNGATGVATGSPITLTLGGSKTITVTTAGDFALAFTAPAFVSLSSASIALAPTYFGADSTTRIAFAGLATSDNVPAGFGGANLIGADVWRFNDATPRALGLGARVHSVDYNGTQLVVGDFDDNVVYNSSDMLAGAPTLTAVSSFQRPSGASVVNMTKVGFAGTTVVASTNGAESAFSISTDKGVTFNDVSFIRTSTTSFQDLAVTADGATAYFVSDNGAAPANRVASVSETITAAGLTTTAAGSSIAITGASQGAGYTVAPVVTFSLPAAANGIQATANATISAGGVTQITIITQGTGYFTAPSITIASPAVGTSGGVGPSAAGANISVWRRDAAWVRVLSLPKTGSLANATGFSIDIAPDDPKSVYLTALGTSNVYYSPDGGDTNWTLRVSNSNIKDLVVESKSVLYYLTASGKVAQSTNAGFIWGTEVSAGTLTSGNMMVGLGAKNLLVSSQVGTVAYSVDSGVTWTTVTGSPAVASGSSIPLTVTASGLATGKAIYAIPLHDATGTDIMGDFVYRNVIGGTAGWEKISPQLKAPTVAATPLMAMDLRVDKSGALYLVSHVTYVDGTAFDSYLWRALDPTLPAATLQATTTTTVAPIITTPTAWGVVSMGGTAAAPVIADVSNFLESATVSSNTKIYSSALAVGSGGSNSSVKATIMAFTDLLVTATPKVAAPADKATIPINPISGNVNDVVYSWPRLAGASSYTLQIGLDKDFNAILKEVTINSSEATVSTVVGPSTGVAYNFGQTYFFRVRVAGISVNGTTYPWFSPYSTVASATVSTGAPATTPPAAVVVVKLNAPTSGMTGVGLTPTFSWTAVTGAASYEIQVDTDPNFAAPVIKNAAVTTNVFVGTAPLKASTVYYWRVRATVGTTASAFTTDVFTTAAPAPAATTAAPPVTVIQTQLPPATTPGYIWAIIAIGAILIIAVLILVMRTGRKA